jgi:3-oxoacyl-[acyl-carrier protein] reductase
MAGRLHGKSAVITGASRGIGKGVARVFVAEGARVLIAGRDEQAGNRTAEELRQAGGEVAFCGADISRRGDAERMAREAVDRFGQLDILVSNAGIFPSSKIEDMKRSRAGGGATSGQQHRLPRKVVVGSGARLAGRDGRCDSP